MDFKKFSDKVFKKAVELNDSGKYEEVYDMYTDTNTLIDEERANTLKLLNPKKRAENISILSKLKDKLYHLIMSDEIK
jgi:hypothetical protein